MRLIWRRPAPPDPGLLLLRSICHELSPPMATLTSLARVLEHDPPGPRRAEIARLAAEHAVHAQDVLRRAAAAAYGLAPEESAAEPLGRILPGVAATAPPGRLTVGVSRAAARWNVHPGHTRQILINLVSNAVRYSSGPIRLSARLRGRRLRLTVADQGGLTPELATALRRRTPPPGEQGLGLWVVRQLVATHRGTVRARGLTPTGLAVEVTLPRYQR